MKGQNLRRSSVYQPGVRELKYQGVDKSLARPGRKQPAPVKSVMGRGMAWFG